jgi:hypothetical protein
MVLFDGSVCGEAPAAGQRAAQLWGLLGARGAAKNKATANQSPLVRLCL